MSATQPRRALVTGGSSPIGAAICRRLAEDGHEVLIHAHAGLARAEALAAEITARGGRAHAFACDLTDMPATASLLEGLLSKPGRCRSWCTMPARMTMRRSPA